jgi:hypothetical protein
MVVQDGGSHLRSSGAEDCCNGRKRSGRSSVKAVPSGDPVDHDGRGHSGELTRNCLPKRRFPAIHRLRRGALSGIFGAIFQSQ